MTFIVPSFGGWLTGTACTASTQYSWLWLTLLSPVWGFRMRLPFSLSAGCPDDLGLVSATGTQRALVGEYRAARGRLGRLFRIVTPHSRNRAAPRVQSGNEKAYVPLQPVLFSEGATI